MTSCDMCGKTARLVKTKIEGTVLDVCEQCARFGEAVSKSKPIPPKNIFQARPAQPTPRRPEIMQMILQDYSKLIRQARERKGLTQEQFAGQLNEKESIIQKMENGQFKPSIKLARKLEKILHIQLVDQYDEKGEIPLQTKKSKSEGFTLGDFVKDKRKKV